MAEPNFREDPHARPTGAAAHPFWPKDLPARFTLPATSLHFNLRTTAARYPDKPAYRYYGSALTWDGLLRDAEALAGWLQQRCGVKRGDRVVVMGQTSPQFATAVHAVLRADAVAVPVNAMLLTDEIAHCVRDSGARTVIAAQELMERIAPLLGDTLDQAIVYAYADALHGSTDDEVPACARTLAPPRHAAVTAWRDVLGAALVPTPHAAGPTTTRPSPTPPAPPAAQGLPAHAPQPDGRRDHAAAVARRQAGQRLPRRRADVSHAGLPGAD